MMPAWQELAIAACIAATLVYWIHRKDRFTSIGPPIFFGAGIMLIVLGIVPGDIRRTFDIFFAIYIEPTVGTLFGLIVFLALLWLVGTWVAETIRKRREYRNSASRDVETNGPPMEPNVS
jgi:hypothetical protein